jgi:7-carboxy-7-deazaguanine synthase
LTIEGEGPLAGTPCSFVRFGGCDYKCQWCDTPHAVLAAKVRDAPRLTATEIREAVCAIRPNSTDAPSRWCTFTGGNPCLYELGEAVDMLQWEGWKIKVETQGTKCPAWLARVAMIVVSPKPPSAGEKDTLSHLKAFLLAMPTFALSKVFLKVVVFNEEDLDYARKIHTIFSALPFYISCGTFPYEAVGSLENLQRREASVGRGPGSNGDTNKSLGVRYRWLAEAVAADSTLSNVRVYPQLHFIAWGHERGH